MLGFLRSLFLGKEKSPDERVIGILKKYWSITYEQFSEIYPTYYARCQCVCRLAAQWMELKQEKKPIMHWSKMAGQLVTYYLI